MRKFWSIGDALVLPTRCLLAILKARRTHMPAVRRISSDRLPCHLGNKSQQEIDQLAATGLGAGGCGALYSAKSIKLIFQIVFWRLCCKGNKIFN